ncbi:hypothetical protein [Clavibacter nebraskensis]|uniref:hypothetical protein n=1 Tax=Clavibacter nebraskensis TaxID=31963 RepID=UPI003F4C27A2
MRAAFKAILFRSTVTLGWALVAAIGAAIAINGTRPGFLLWPDLITGFTSASIFTGLIAAGAAATEANRWHKANGQRQASASRGRLQVRAAHAVAVIAPLGLGFWVAFAIVAVWAQVNGYYGSVPMAWIFSLFCALILASSFGYAVGSMTPYRWYIGPIVGLAFYVGYVALTLTGARNGVLALYPAAGSLDTIFVEPVNSTFVAQSVFFLSLSSVLILLTVLTIRIPRKIAISALGFLVIAVLSGGSVVAANGQTTSPRNPGMYTCVGAAPTLCLNPGYAPAAEPLHAEFARLASITSGTGFVADRLEQNVEGIGDEPSQGARSVYLEQWAAQDDLTFAVSRYVSKYGGLAQCDAPDAAYVNEQVDIWLSRYDPYEGSLERDNKFDALYGLSTADAHAWFSSVSDKYFSCKLQLGDLP